jgi:hypothetical protein
LVSHTYLELCRACVAEKRNSYTPCNTVQNSTVNLELKAENITLLKAALESLGYAAYEQNTELHFTAASWRSDEYGDVRGTFVNGKLELTGERYAVARFEREINAVKKAYSVQVVQSQAKKFGWKLKQKKQGELKFQVQKRGF